MSARIYLVAITFLMTAVLLVGCTKTVYVPYSPPPAQAPTTTTTQKLLLLSTSVNPASSGYISPGGGQYTYGSTVTLTATASPGYIFDSWSGDVFAAGPTVLVGMDSDVHAIANFVSPSTQTITITQVIWIATPNLVIGPGIWDSPSSGINVPGGKTLSLSWSADGSLECFIFTSTQYDNFKPLGIASAWMASGSGSQGSITANIQNGDSYYAVLKNNAIILGGPSIKLYQATLTER